MHKLSYKTDECFGLFYELFSSLELKMKKKKKKVSLEMSIYLLKNSFASVLPGANATLPSFSSEIIASVILLALSACLASLKSQV